MFDDGKDELIKQKIKEGINKMKKELDDKKWNIEYEIREFLENELKNFDIKNFKFKNGKIIIHYEYNNTSTCYTIHDNIMEVKEIDENENKEQLKYVGDFVQNNESCYIDNILIPHGRGKSMNKFVSVDYPNTESEIFYSILIGRGKVIGDKKDKFFFGCQEFWKSEKQNDNENITIYSFYDYNDSYVNNIIAEVYNNKRNNQGKILVKDLDGKTIIYEINVNMKITEESYGQYASPEGMGIVKDYRNGDILIVNFDTNNIITDNIKDLTLFLDKEEFDMNKEEDNIEEKNENKLDPTKEISNNNKDNEMNAKEIINEMINYGIEDDINLEKLTNKVNEKIAEEKIKHFGIKDQERSGECWIYSLAGIIYMANARKYGRKLDNFETIYDSITKKYGRGGKTVEEREKIMNAILKKDYDLDFEKIIDEDKIKEFIKKGIKCLCSFGLSKREWDNFSNYLEKQSKEEEKILTNEILDQPIDNINNPDEIDRHAVILIDIDKDDNYILLNSWGEKWGNKGIFKAKKECLKNSVYYAIYFYPSLLKKEEIEAWNKLKNIIKNSLKEIKSIRCPKCKRKARIEKFDVIDRNKLKCPFEDACIFEIKNEENNYDEFSFLAEFLLDNKKKLFDFGFID